MSLTSVDMAGSASAEYSREAMSADALAELEHFRSAWRGGALPATIAAVHLHAAGDALHELIGGIDTEQVLDEVFRRFCVGK